MAEHTLKYKRTDVEGGYIYDKDDIDYYRAIQQNDVADNLLLGNFNQVGSYVVNNSIVQELIAVKKIYTDSFDKKIFCESEHLFNDKHFNFCLMIINNTPKKGKVTVSLELLEEIERINGYYKNTNSVILDSKVFNDGKTVEQQIYNFYHIGNKKSVGDDGDDGISGGEKIETDYDYLNIIKRQEYLQKYQSVSSPITSRAQKKLYEKRIKILLKNPTGSLLLEDFNRMIFHLKGRFVDKNDKDFYKNLNQILDSIFENRSVEISQDKNLQKNLRIEQAEFSKFSNKSNELFANKANEFIANKTMENANQRVSNESKTTVQNNLENKKASQTNPDKPAKKNESDNSKDKQNTTNTKKEQSQEQKINQNNQNTNLQFTDNKKDVTEGIKKESGIERNNTPNPIGEKHNSSSGIKNVNDMYRQANSENEINGSEGKNEPSSALNTIGFTYNDEAKEQTTIEETN